MTATPTAHAVASEIPLAAIRISPRNPRKHFDQAALGELTESVRRMGVLQPVLVRPKADKRSAGTGASYELVAGERRYRAAKAAGLETIPAVVRELSDLEALELAVIENLHRADLHPMEEAEGYELLHREHGLSVDELAAKVGKSKAYVYGRMKLCALTKDAREAFFQDRMTAGHAVILARLHSETQKRLIGTADDPGALFQVEQLLWKPEDIGEDDEDVTKAISVRELQAWVDKHVRFDVEDVDPMIFPETAEVLDQVEQAEEKLIPITFDHYVPPEARVGRTWGPRSWKRADGTGKNKGCEHAVTGVIVIGPGRGDTFRVCVAKEKCKTHWGAEIRAKAERKTGVEAGGEAPSKSKSRWEREEAKRKAQQEKEDAKRARWEKAVPAILKAVAAAVLKSPTEASGLLAQLVVEHARGWHGGRKPVAEPVPLGETAEDALRHAAWLLLKRDASSWRAWAEFPKRAKAFGLDVGKILAAAAPEAQTSAKAPKGGKAKGKAAAKAASSKGARTKATKASPAPKRARKAKAAAPPPENPLGIVSICDLHGGPGPDEAAPKGGRKRRAKNASALAGRRVAGDETMALVAATDPVACRKCQCTEDDCSGCVERTGEPCSWVEPDLCSACA